MLETYLALLCIGLNSPGNYQYYPACNSIVQATYIQTGLKSNFNNFEKQTIDDINKKTIKKLPLTEQQILGASMFIYQASQKNELNLNTGKTPLFDNANIVLNNSSVNLNLIWTY
jgi:hypothetical protein